MISSPALSIPTSSKGFLASNAMSVVYGPSNSGKTFFALDIAFHLSIGQGGTTSGQRSRCSIWQPRAAGRPEPRRRPQSEYGVVDVPMAVKRWLDLLHAQADLQHIADLAAAVAEKRAPGLPMLIVVDTLSRVMAGGDETAPPT